MPFHIAESMAALFAELCSRLVAADMSYCCTAPVMRCKNVVAADMSYCCTAPVFGVQEREIDNERERERERERDNARARQLQIS